ncbi:hypothetical protein KC331_g10070 [Hortaea werneckii]|nr:hypothetical protein KC331_g10070 [Hortaea werneckii]KAI7718506.1 hypothetical protein KC353_g3731 [Hortaea werneckii]
MARPVKLDCHETQPSREAILAMALLHARATNDRAKKSPVSVFSPYHTTNIKYPSVSLLAHTEDLYQGDIFMLPVENASERFEPKPLVNDPAIAAHAFRCSHEETAIFSLSAASIGLESEQEIVQQAKNWASTKVVSHSALTELCGHMRVLSKQQGGTSLSVLTYDNRGQNCVLIKRHTSLFVGQGRFTACPSVMYIATVEGLRSTKCTCEFMQNLQDVVFRRTDRAFLHVQHMLQYHQPDTTARIHDVAHSWKAKRRPNYESFEFKIAEPIPLESIPEGETSCNTCGNDLDTAAYRPLQMKCCGNHICRHCYINWADSKGPNNASCIYCRGRFFDEPIAESMTAGTVNGYYYPYLPPNHRFTAYENFERSCADLDRNLAENNQTKMTVDPALLLRIWDHLVEGARLEDARATSTPFRIQPARYPELQTARNIFREDMCWHAGSEWPTANLFAELWRNQLRGFRDEVILAGGRTKHEKTGELMHWVDARSPHVGTNPRNVGGWLRPGTLEFVRRLLNRMLQFVHVRMCSVEEGRTQADTTCVGMHGHGARMYVGGMGDWRKGAMEGYFDPEAGALLCWRQRSAAAAAQEEEEEDDDSDDDYLSDWDEEGSPYSPSRPTFPRGEDLTSFFRIHLPGLGGGQEANRSGISFPPRTGLPEPRRDVQDRGQSP